VNLVWATRGRTWGFRFLLDGGYSDPLPVYERAFGGTEGDSTTCRHVGSHVALRFPDPQARRDTAGRTIPHDVVVLPPLAQEIRSVEDGQQLLWPLLADAFAQLWDLPEPPSPDEVTQAFRAGRSDLGKTDAAEINSDSVREPVHTTPDTSRP